MPIYHYINKNTEERVEVWCSIAEKDVYEKENPHMERLFESMNICDPVSLGVTKPPSDFSKYVLNRVAQVPGANHGEIYKRRDKVREI